MGLFSSLAFGLAIILLERDDLVAATTPRLRAHLEKPAQGLPDECNDADTKALQSWEGPRKPPRKPRAPWKDRERALFSGGTNELETLWTGFDPSDSAEKNDNRTESLPRVSLLSHHRRDLLPANSSAEHVVVLGPMHAGTHLLSKALELNWPHFKEARCLDWLEPCETVWKHEPLASKIAEDAVRKLDSSDLSRTALVAIVRSPIANLVALKSHPYNGILKCICRPFTLMSQPCESFERVWNGTLGIFNQYMMTYRELRDSGKFASVTIVPYEDMVYTPELVVRNLGEVLGWAVPEEIKTPARGVWGAGHDLAMKRIKERSHMRYVAPVLPALCSTLSRSAFADVMEGSHEADPSLRLSYLHDCEGLPMAE